jgi:signal transduction histidine kinase
MRRAVLFVLAALLVVFAAGGALSAWLSGSTGMGGRPFVAAIVAMAVLAVGITLGAWAVRRLAVPLADVMEAADRLATGEYSARVRERGSPGFRRLARSFNEMAGRLQEGEQRRRDLLADVAHELRTPLSVIRGTTEGLLDGMYPRDDAHIAPLVEESVLMAHLLDDLQTLSTAEAGVLQLYPESTDVGRLIEDTVAAFSPRAEAGGVSLEVQVHAGPPLEVDPVRMREILENLLTNALRYTPPGGRVRVESSADAGGGVTIAVTDTGRGIAAHDLSSVFDRFSKTSDSGGSGLGLAIAKRLVEAHGGEIRAEAPSPGGTRFVVTLPVH